MGAPRKDSEFARKLETFPYTIPPVQCPDKETVDSHDPAVVLEFFRIEALLRSKAVHQLYTQRKMNPKSQTDEFTSRHAVHIGWNALTGAHHCALRPNDTMAIGESFGVFKVKVRKIYSPEFFVGQGIVDLTGLANHDPNLAKYHMWQTLDRTEDGPRAVVLAIDPARPPEATIKDLRPYLRQLYKPYKGKKQLDEQFLNRSLKSGTQRPKFIIGVHKPGVTLNSHPYRKPPFTSYKSIETWLNYFRCYDLRTTQPLSFGEIAEQVYGTNTRQTYERAEQGYKRVCKLIRCAEQNDWPPPPIC